MYILVNYNLHIIYILLFRSNIVYISITDNKWFETYLYTVQGVRKKTELNNSLLSRKIIYALHYIIVNISMEYIKRINLSYQYQYRPRCCR